MEIFENGHWLPLLFAAVMALAALVYAILDGYDIGVGILMNYAKEDERDIMISSIGPFWDANETWLVLTIGVMLIAFPAANGVFMTNLYLPIVLMLCGLILRGVSFDFRAKAKVEHKNTWDRCFIGGSFLMAVAQGYMLGSYIMGFKAGLGPWLFSLATGVSLAAAYALIGACWLIIKTEGPLQDKVVRWARNAAYGSAAAMVLVGLATPMASDYVFQRWFTYPDVLLLIPVPIIMIGLFSWLEYRLRALCVCCEGACWEPFAMTAGIYLMGMLGLAYSFYPYIIPGKMLIVDAASAPESLIVILVGVLLVLPFLIGYTIFAYKVFSSKTRELTYN